jgi:2-haloalkanoic acid dehalogenase type II
VDRTWDVITFDCYGTLIDWERGIADAFHSAMRADGVTAETAQILAAYHAIEPAVQAEPYRSYRAVLMEAARRVAARLGWRLADGRADFLPESLPSWPPFPDTNPTLHRLARAGYRLGILSNVDDRLLEGTRRNFPVDFDVVVTAEQVGAYKPAASHFLVARKRIGRDRWLHAAQSYFHDIRPARAMGIANVWINRKNERPTDDGRADRELHTLTDLADWLT